ncbi:MULTISPECIES: hypothetical protein [unclassified Roseitalea]|uniref:hypothetical protein n=1 Tax=unclassified Roseitalea TaxID=2639107 RepID=UPI00273FD4EA|nr:MULTISPECIES: hypothetical protein [unclassified Roseitalea]
MSGDDAFSALIDFARERTHNEGGSARPFVPFFGEEAPPHRFDDLPRRPAHGERRDYARAEPASRPQPPDPETPARPNGAHNAGAEPFPPEADEPAAPPPPPEPSAEELAAKARVAELEAEIDNLNQAHQREVADLVAGAIAGLPGKVTQAVSAQLAGVVEAAVMDHIETRALNAFIERLGALIERENAVKVKVSGPQALLDRLRANWSAPMPLPELVAGDEVELVARVDETVLSTRLEELRAIVRGERS